MKKYIAILLLVLSISSFAQNLESLLERLPAQTPATRDSISTLLLSMGESAIFKVCKSLNPAGLEDTAQKYAVTGLCDFAARAGAEQRGVVASAMLKALKDADNWQVKAFLIEQLALVGDAAHVAALQPYLHDEHLCDPAARAMLVMDPGTSEEPLISALSGADRSQLLTIVNVLGELGSSKAAPVLLQLLDGSKGEWRDVLLYALARSGHPDAGAVLQKASEQGTDFERQKATCYYFDFIEKQPEEMAARLYREVLSKKPVSHLACRALSGLFNLEKESALPDLLRAAHRKELDILACALRLTRSIPGKEVSEKWIEFAEMATPDKRALIVRALGGRHDAASISYVSSALNDADVDVRIEAITAIARLRGVESSGQLFEVLRHGSAEEVETARHALASYASDTALLPRLHKEVLTLPPLSQAAVIHLFTERGATGEKPLIIELAKIGNAPVRMAAFQALAGMAEPKDVGQLLDFVQETEDEKALELLQEALVRAANLAAPVIAAPIIKAFALSTGQQKIALLGALSQLNDADALRQVLTAAIVKETRREALQAFASGPQASAIPALITILKDANDEIRPMAFQKTVRLLKSGRGLSLEQRLEYLERLMRTTKQDDEKRTILSIAGEMHSIESLEFIEPYLEFSGTQQAAANAAAVAVLPPRDGENGLTAPKVVEVLFKVLAIPGDEERAENVKAYLEKIGVGRGMNPETGSRLNDPPPGFVRLFNGRDLSGWKGLTGKGGNPYERANLSPQQLALEQVRADSVMRAHWSVKDGVLVFDGHGSHLCTVKEFRNFEMLVDWKIGPGGDSGIYLRGAPQVQIWDPAKWPEGSGGLYNNKKGPSKPLVRADHPIGEWNTFRIKMIDDRVTVYLNDKLVVDHVVLENYWDRSQPIFTKGQIELQSHGSTLYFRNIFIREIFTQDDGWTPLFDGKTLQGWTGAVDGYEIQNGAIVCKQGSGGNLFTEREYDDFEITFEFKLTPGANSGLGIRAPLKGDAAYKGMELQILDNSAIRYAELKPYQYHGSIYGVVPAKRGCLKPVGEWNVQRVRVKGDSVRVELNGAVIVDADLSVVRKQETLDHRRHPGLKRKKGHIGFLGHDAHVEFRNIYAREINNVR